MQSGRAYINEGTGSKPKILLLISLVIVSVITIPLILPHINHPSMIYHIILHAAGVIIAVFLTIISVMSYRRNRSSKVLFMSLAFLSLGIVESLYLLNATDILIPIDIPIINIELSHLLLLFMLVLFGTGVLTVSKQK